MKASSNPRPRRADISSPAKVDLTDVDRYRVAHLATADPRGKPLVVPVCFACGKDCIYSVLDEKPKRVTVSRLRRVRNIIANPQVCLLVDHYEEDWSRLAYILIEGTAKILYEKTERTERTESTEGTERTEATERAEYAEALRLLRVKYPQYRAMRLDGRPVIKISPQRFIPWKATPTAE